MELSYEQIMSGLNGQNGRAMSPLLMPHMDIAQVDGEIGARNLAMGPNSQTIALDRTKNLLCWFIKTDQMGNKEIISPYTLTPYVPEQPPDFNKLQAMLETVIQKQDQQAAAYETLSQKVNSLEEAFK